jgi:hypothetical protein
MGPDQRIISWDFPDDFDYSTQSSAKNESSLVSKLEKIEKKGTSIRFALPAEEENSSSTNMVKSDADIPMSNNSTSNADKASNPAKQKGRFSIVEGNSPQEPSGPLSTTELEETTTTPVSTCNLIINLTYSRKKNGALCYPVISSSSRVEAVRQHDRT